MRPADVETTVYRTEDLLPPAWRGLVAESPVRTFNPALLRDGNEWLFAYRVATDTQRKIGLCRLDAALRVVAGSHVPLTDYVRFPAGRTYPEVVSRWFADPRLYRLAGRLFIHWNSGWHEPQNHQFLQELDAATLQPIGHPRELVLRGVRQKLEKNWTLFGEGDGPFHAIYSVMPHRVLGFSLAGEGDIEFVETARTEWTLGVYPPCHGGLRGGAPPQRVGEAYWSFCHTVHDDPAGYRYAAAAYRFSAEFPFAPVAEPVAPLPLGASFGADRLHPRLNPAVSAVIYPCGAALHDGRWLVSHGVNDERCAISTLAPGQVAATLRPVPPA